MSNDTNDERPSRAGEASTVSRIEEAHRELNRRLHALASATDCRGLMLELAGLPKTLAEHFAEEESSDGLYERLQCRRPSVHSELAALRREHEEMLRAVEALQHRLKLEMESEDSGRPLLYPKSQVSELLARLRRHEHDESQLIADVYYSDEGSSG